MEDLYKVDLDSFVAFDSDVQFSSMPAEREYQGEEEYGEEAHSEPEESEEEW